MNTSRQELSLVQVPRGDVRTIPPPIDMWPESVDGSTLLNEISEVYQNHMVLPTCAGDAIVLWIAHAHCVQAFLHSPRLCFASPERGCGKSVGLDIIACLVPRPICIDNPNEAVLGRAIQRFNPTVILDGYDNWLKPDRKLLSLLNAGHKRDAMRIRSNGDQIQLISVFGPVAIGGIGSLPDTLEDRSIVIHLTRAKLGEIKQPFDLRNAQMELVLRQKLARWTNDMYEEIQSCKPTMPEGAINRCADNWRPLLAIAEVVGGAWHRRAINAFNALNGSSVGCHRSPASELLADIRRIFQARQACKLASSDLASELSDMEGRPWAGFGRNHQQNISSHQLAFLLRPYGIGPRTIRVGSDTVKGYHLSDFRDAFQRFCPEPPECNVC